MMNTIKKDRFEFIVLPCCILLFSFSTWATPGATFDVSLSPAGNFVGKAPDVKGQAVMTGNKVKAENIRVNLQNVTTGVSLRDKHTRDKYLEVDKYPEAILTKGEGENGKGTGILKIKDKENPVSGTYVIQGNELSAEFPIKLSSYGITGIKYMGIGAKDDVVIKVIVPVVKK